MYGLRYAEFVVPLVKAVQELNLINQEQQTAIDILKAENAALLQRLTAIENKFSGK